MRWGAWPVCRLGLGDSAADVSAAQTGIAQLQTMLAGADGQLGAQQYDGAVAAYKTAGALAQNVVAPAIATAGGDYGVAASSYAPSFAAATTFLATDNAALQQVASSSDPTQPVATLDSAMGAQKLAYAMLDQAQAMMGFVQDLRGTAPAAPAAGGPTKGKWVMPAVWIFAGAIGAALIVHHVDEARRS